MSEKNEPQKSGKRQYAVNVMLVGAAGAAGCITVVILFIALVIGILITLLDNVSLIPTFASILHKDIFPLNV